MVSPLALAETFVSAFVSGDVAAATALLDANARASGANIFLRDSHRTLVTKYGRFVSVRAVWSVALAGAEAVRAAGLERTLPGEAANDPFNVVVLVGDHQRGRVSFQVVVKGTAVAGCGFWESLSYPPRADEEGRL